MKMKTFSHTNTGKTTVGTTLVDDTPRADVYFPVWMLSSGIFMVMFGAICETVSLILQISVLLILLSAVLLLAGIITIMCWKNQTVRMISDESFVYSTLLGKKTVCRFDDIKGLKKNMYSTVLFVAEKKVYVDSSAIVTDRFAERINKKLKELDADGTL